jgi:4-hydroxybenzoate polyprenyltransferase
MRAWGRLLRLSLAPSAAADIAAGVVLGAGRWPRAAWPWLLILASLCVYHGAMALNDWADREADARLRPERPIPSGAVAAPAALALAAVLLAAGPLLATAAPGPRPAACLGLAALLAVLYDVAGRGPLIGPALLALCRWLNLTAGIAAGIALLPDAHAASPALHASVPLLYAAYVFTVSRLGRLEDLPAGTDLGRRPARLLTAAALLLVALPLPPVFLSLLQSPPAPSPHPASAVAALLVAAAGAFGLLRAARKSLPWTPPDVLRAMGLALRRLLLCTAAAALLAPPPDGAVVAAAILCGYPVAHGLRRVFPPS